MGECGRIDYTQTVTLSNTSTDRAKLTHGEGKVTGGPLWRGDAIMAPHYGGYIARYWAKNVSDTLHIDIVARHGVCYGKGRRIANDNASNQRTV